MVDVIVVHYQTPEALKACLASLRAAAIPLVRIVDNNSGVLPALPSYAPMRVTWLCCGENRGFGAACNAAAKLSDAPYVLFLNADIQVEPDTIAAALEAIQSDAQCAAAGVRLVDNSLNPQISRLRFPRPRHFAQRALGLPRLRRPAFSAYDDRREGSGPCDCVLGAFFLVRRSAFEKVNGFDEGYFLYFEELDLARRLNKQGYHCLYLSQVKAVHMGGASTQALGEMHLYHSLVSRFRYARAHWPKRDILALKLISFGIEPWTRCAQLLFQRRLQQMRTVPGVYLRAMRALHTRRQA